MSNTNRRLQSEQMELCLTSRHAAITPDHTSSNTHDTLPQPDLSYLDSVIHLSYVGCETCGFPAPGCETYTHYLKAGWLKVICQCQKQSDPEQQLSIFD